MSHRHPRSPVMPPSAPLRLGTGFDLAWYLFKVAMFCLGCWTLLESWRH